MKKFLLTLTLTAAVGFSMACNEEKPAEPAKPTTTTTTTTTTTSTPAPTAASDKIGIAECDEYLAAYEKCLDNPKVPAAAKTTMKTSLETTRKSWKDALDKVKGTPGSEAVTKATTDACKQAATALKANNLCK